MKVKDGFKFAIGWCIGATLFRAASICISDPTKISKYCDKLKESRRQIRKAANLEDPQKPEMEEHTVKNKIGFTID